MHPQVRASYLASPPLCVAYALAGRIDVDLTTEPLGEGSDGPVFLADIWPSADEVRDAMATAITESQYATQYGRIWSGDEHWQGLPTPSGPVYDWDPASTYVQEPPFFEDLGTVAAVADIEGARVLVKVGDSITTDHISPAGSIKVDSPAGEYLREHGVEPVDFNSYGSRRGNHEVMMRGTFANIRLRNEMAPGTEGSFTTHLPTGEVMSIFEAATRYRDAGIPSRRARRQGVRQRLEPRLGGEGTEPAGRAVRAGGELRADPPVEPGGHGRAAAAVRAGGVGGFARAGRHARRSRSAASRPGSRRASTPRWRPRAEDGTSTAFSGHRADRRRRRGRVLTRGGILRMVLGDMLGG